MNALLKSNQVNEMEGGILLGFDQEANSGFHASDKKYGYDDTNSCTAAFRVLKQLIQRCLADAVTSGNVYADALLQHLYRWLCRFNFFFFLFCTFFLVKFVFCTSYPIYAPSPVC